MALGQKKAMEGFKTLVSVDEALRELLRRVAHRPDVVEKPVEEALAHVAAEDVTSPTDFPPFDRSAVDGYAVIASDTLGASLTNPVVLTVKYQVDPGTDPSRLEPLQHGEAAVIFTGAPLPPGADAVVMAEDASLRGDRVFVTRQVSPYQNVSRRGEDFTKGKPVIRRGQIVRPWHIGALASLGIAKIKVYRPVRVAIISTGDEVVDLPPEGGLPGPGKIINSTKPLLKALLRLDFFEPVDLGTVPDDVDRISSLIREGLSKADAVITTGGTSIGARDLVAEAVASVGEVVFNGVRMRPGKPTGAGVAWGKPIFMLSGFPVAALAGYVAFVRPTLRHMTGTPEDPASVVRGKITRRGANVAGVRTYLRVRVLATKEGYLVEPLAITASGVLSTLTDANGLLVIPENVEGYDEGDEVEVVLIGPPLEAY